MNDQLVRSVHCHTCTAEGEDVHKCLIRQYLYTMYAMTCPRDGAVNDD